MKTKVVAHRTEYGSAHDGHPYDIVAYSNGREAIIGHAYRKADATEFAAAQEMRRFLEMLRFVLNTEDRVNFAGWNGQELDRLIAKATGKEVE